MHPIIRKLSGFASFTQEEEHAVALAFSRTEVVPAGSDIVRQDDEPDRLYFLLHGFAVRHKLMLNGRRQILAFMLPGDSCDMGVTLLEKRDHSMQAMTDSIVSGVSEPNLGHLITNYPKLGAALQWATLVEEAIAREWMINIGQRSALARAAHLFCEVSRRCRALGQSAEAYELPLIQSDLADTFALSAVHVNRTLQELRARKLIAFGDKRVAILDLDGLETLAEFDHSYLHLGARYDPHQHALRS